MPTTNTNGNWVKTWDRSGRKVECYDPTTPTNQASESAQNPSDKSSKPK